MSYHPVFYSKKERKVIIALIIFMTLAIALLYFLGDGNDMSNPATGTDSLAASRKFYRNDSTDGIGKNERFHGGKNGKKEEYYAVDVPGKELFPFDPNTADSTELLRLGLQPWQVRNIYKYRAHGGIYRSERDFARLYGLTRKQFLELQPYIRISPDYSQPASTLFADEEERTYERDTIKYPRKISAGVHIVLNTADTTALKRVPGIGSGYARAIINYGKRIGGYVNVDQLDEIEGFPSESKQYFSIDNPSPQKLNVNKLTISQLRRHPYINYYQARDIVDYRKLYGRINKLTDLKLSPSFTADDIKRLEPYIEY